MMKLLKDPQDLLAIVIVICLMIIIVVGIICSK